MQRQVDLGVYYWHLHTNMIGVHQNMTSVTVNGLYLLKE